MSYFLYIDNEKKYKLTKFAPLGFTDSCTLYINTDDLKGVKESLSNFSSISVYHNDIETMHSESFDGYKNMIYNENVYSDEENDVCPELAVTLTKKNIVDQVKALEKQINPVVDFDTLDLAQTKAVIKQQLNDSCQKTIYKGIDVTLASGEVQHFSLTSEDQTNIDSLATLIQKDPSIASLPFPYHGDAKKCELYDSKDILSIYIGMKMKIVQETTYCNLIKSQVDGLGDKESVKAVTYGTQLNEELQGVYDTMMNASNAIMETVTRNIQE